MTEIKGKYKVPKLSHENEVASLRSIPIKIATTAKHAGWGGARVAGEGKHMGPPTVIGSNPHTYQNYLDDETIEALKRIHPNRSLAIRMLAKNSLS